MSKSHNNSHLALEQLGKIIHMLPRRNHLNVHSCCSMTLVPDSHFSQRKDDLFTILYVTAGRGHALLNTSDENLVKGKFLFVSSEMPFHIASMKKSALSFIIMRFSVYDNQTLKPSNPITQSFSFAAIPGMVQRYSRLFQTALRHFSKDIPALHDMLCAATAAQIIGEMYGTLHFRKNNPKKRDERMVNAKMMLDNNPISTLTIEQLAIDMGLAPKYFSSLFKQNYGISPKKYFLKVKMNYAVFLLESTGKKIKEVALMVGYPDQYSFSKQFKRAMGYCPSEVRKKRK